MNEQLQPFEEVKHLVQTMEMGGGDHWLGYFSPLGISIIGKTENDVMAGIEEAYNTHESYINFDKTLE